MQRRRYSSSDSDYITQIEHQDRHFPLLLMTQKLSDHTSLILAPNLILSYLLILLVNNHGASEEELCERRRDII